MRRGPAPRSPPRARQGPAACHHARGTRDPPPRRAHAITVEHDPALLQEKIEGFAIDLIACGLDPAKTTLFVQSDVHEHMELAWYLSAVTAYGDLQRMTQFKDKGEGKDFVSAALFT